MKTPTRIAGTAIAALSLTGLTLSAGSVSARPVTQDGLVNVNADDVNIQVPISVAAGICGVAVNVLATAPSIGSFDCETDGVALAQNDGGDGGPVRQRGLINVNLSDVDAQVPVSVAATVCGVSVGVLSMAPSLSDVVCDTEGVALAEIL